MATLHVTGMGGELAACDVARGATAKIEKWFRDHPDFGTGMRTPPESETSPTPPPSSMANISIADELRKLAELREAHVITEEEFERLKARLLS